MGDGLSESVAGRLSPISFLGFPVMTSREIESNQGNYDGCNEIADIRDQLRWHSKVLMLILELVIFWALIRPWLLYFL
jgi:hypothetical protein